MACGNPNCKNPNCRVPAFSPQPPARAPSRIKFIWLAGRESKQCVHVTAMATLPDGGLRVTQKDGEVVVVRPTWDYYVAEYPEEE